MAEIAAFLGLSAAVHAGVMTGMNANVGSPEAQGNGGADRVTLTAAPESVAALVDRWSSPPDVAINPASLPDPQIAAQPALPSFGASAPVLAMPDMPALHHAEDRPPALDMAQTAPAPPAANLVTQSPRPPLRPDTASAPATTPQPARVAQGQGGGAASGRAEQPTHDADRFGQGDRQRLMATWGGQILARIERARPRVNGAGQVTLRLQIARDGSLTGLGIARSSGIASLDEAALAAVRRAGRFPAAPDALREASYAFNLPVRFR